jgi:NarL family two-component system response regulator LiaR
MTSQPLRIAIVNDYDIVVKGTAAVLDSFPDRIKIVELDSRMPVVSDVDIVLYDSFGQVQGDSVDISTLLRGQTSKLVIFSWNTEEQLVERAIASGAAGYLHKGLDADELVSALESVHAGQTVLPTGQDADEFGRWPGDDMGLSARESEVLALICQGLSNQDIAERAFLGINTVKTYIRTAYRKIGVTSRTQAVLWGMQHGFEPDRRRLIVES